MVFPGYARCEMQKKQKEAKSNTNKIVVYMQQASAAEYYMVYSHF